MEPITRIEKLYDAIARGGTIDFEPVTREEKFLYEILKKGIGNGEGGGIFVEGATVGQTVKISAVDENGVPTAWEPMDASYTKPEIDAIMGSYVTDIDTLVGGDG